jgi:hypothetical protein
MEVDNNSNLRGQLKSITINGKPPAPFSKRAASDSMLRESSVLYPSVLFPTHQTASRFINAPAKKFLKVIRASRATFTAMVLRDLGLPARVTASETLILF